MSKKNSDTIILIVDDNKKNLQVLGNILQETGYKIAAAIDGLNAIELAKKTLPDLILLDVMMPVMNGFETCTKLKADVTFRNTPIIFITALSETEDKLKGFQAGGVDYITKPFVQAEVLARVETHLEIARLNKELHKTNKVLQEKQLKIEEDLATAGEIQKSLLPTGKIKFSNIDIAWKFDPCDSVGGDIFNVIQLKGNHYAFYMVDVSGHGIPSSLVAVSVTQALQTYSGLVTSVTNKLASVSITPPTEVLTGLDSQFPMERFDKFFTIFYAYLNCNTGMLSYSHAGHPLGFLVRKNGEIKLLDKGGTIIGLGVPVPFKTEVVKMKAGDKIILFTDGITEYERSDGEIYGDKRFEQSIQKYAGLPCNDFLENVYMNITQFGAGTPPDDDISLLGIEFIPD